MGQTLFFFFCNTFCAGKGSKAWNWSNVNPSQASTLSSCGGYSVLLRTLLSLLLLLTTDMCLCNTTISIAAWCWPRRRFRLVVGTRTNHEFPYRSSALAAAASRQRTAWIHTILSIIFCLSASPHHPPHGKRISLSWKTRAPAVCVRPPSSRSPPLTRPTPPVACLLLLEWVWFEFRLNTDHAILFPPSPGNRNWLALEYTYGIGCLSGCL